MAYINSEMDYKAVYVKLVRVLVFYAGCYDTLHISVPNYLDPNACFILLIKVINLILQASPCTENVRNGECTVFNRG